jgi:uncharacterized protein HemX
MAFGAALGAALVGGSVFQGQQAKQQQRRALRAQERAQREAQGRATRDLRRTEAERRRASRREPNIAALLAFREGQGRQGSASSLSGPRGGGRSALTLGQTSTLGGV